MNTKTETNTNSELLYILLFLTIFIILPSIFFVLVDIPKRKVLKDILSIITILSFFIVLGQFYLTRLIKNFTDGFKAIKIIKVHKLIGYIVLPILLLHPFLIVIPRFFEAGPNPLDSFIKMLTTLDSLSIILGIIAWVLMIVLGLTSLFRDKLKMSYKSWRTFHGILSLAFIIFASWHAIETGRHMSLVMSILLISIVFFASLLLLKSYFFTTNKSTIVNLNEKEESNE